MVNVRGGRIADPLDWKNENLSSQVDGITDTFTTTFAYRSGKILVKVNGIDRLNGISFNELSDTEFQLAYIPESWETLEVWYIKK